MLLLHGFGDTPQTLTALARHLHGAGYSVRAPLYPGHGRTPDAFFSSTGTEWISAASAALASFRGKVDVVSIVGLSMGAAIAAILAADDKEIKSIVLIAPYLRVPPLLRVALPFRRIWGPLIGTVEARHPRSIQDAKAREESLAYGVVNARAMAELARVARAARKALPRILAPTLVIQSREDPRVSESTARLALRRSGAQRKKMVLMNTGGHVVTVDFGKEDVFAETLGWIQEWDGQPRASRLSGER